MLPVDHAVQSPAEVVGLKDDDLAPRGRLALACWVVHALVKELEGGDGPSLACVQGRGVPLGCEELEGVLLVSCEVRDGRVTRWGEMRAVRYRWEESPGWDGRAEDGPGNVMADGEQRCAQADDKVVGKVAPGEEGKVSAQATERWRRPRRLTDPRGR